MESNHQRRRVALRIRRIPTQDCLDVPLEHPDGGRRWPNARPTCCADVLLVAAGKCESADIHIGCVETLLCHRLARFRVCKGDPQGFWVESNRFQYRGGLGKAYCASRRRYLYTRATDGRGVTTVKVSVPRRIRGTLLPGTSVAGCDGELILDSWCLIHRAEEQLPCRLVAHH